MSDQTSLLVQEYYKSDLYNKIPTTYTISETQWNTLCGDTITVYLTIDDDQITAYHYHGKPAQITKAAAEFLGEYLIWTVLSTILQWDANRVRSEGFEVSHRRIRSSISALLAVRNAIHNYFQDGIIDEYEDLID